MIKDSINKMKIDSRTQSKIYVIEINLSWKDGQHWTIIWLSRLFLILISIYNCGFILITKNIDRLWEPETWEVKRYEKAFVRYE